MLKSPGAMTKLSKILWTFVTKLLRFSCAVGVKSWLRFSNAWNKQAKQRIMKQSNGRKKNADSNPIYLHLLNRCHRMMAWLHLSEMPYQNEPDRMVAEAKMPF